MKLELKHLAPYLPHGLWCEVNYIEGKEVKPFEIRWVTKDFNIYSDIKPILRPLSDLTNEFKYDFRFTERTITIHKHGLDYWVKGLRFDIVEFLLKNHFDVFGLIEQGLAIDINTL